MLFISKALSERKYITNIKNSQSDWLCVKENNCHLHFQKNIYNSQSLIYFSVQFNSNVR